MKEIFKRFSALLCLVAMLSFVSIPAFGGENPWDSDSSSEDTPDSESGGSGMDYVQPFYLGTVYIGVDGLLTFVSQSVNYLATYFTYLGRRATERPDSRTETSQQKDF